MNSILEVTHLTKKFPGFTLQDVSFSIPYGTILGLIGENGAGKTTTIQLILQILHQEEGTIQVFGHQMSDRDKEDIGVVFSDEAFYDTLQLTQVANMMKNIYRQWDEDVFQTYCERFSLPLNKQIKEYSRGMKVKLHLAIALSHHPKLLILDEPTSGLDAVMRDELMDILLDFIQDEQHAILISSHISSDLEKIADHIMFIKNGRMVFLKEKDNLLEHYGVVHCTRAQVESMDPSEYIGLWKHDLSIDLLVEDKEGFQRKHKDMVMDDADLDTIQLMYAKGEIHK